MYARGVTRHRVWQSCCDFNFLQARDPAEAGKGWASECTALSRWRLLYSEVPGIPKRWFKRFLKRPYHQQHRFDGSQESPLPRRFLQSPGSPQSPKEARKKVQDKPELGPRKLTQHVLAKEHDRSLEETRKPEDAERRHRNQALQG